MPELPALQIVVAGGHSAGHIEPAMNVADAIRRLDPTAGITAIGTQRGLDTTLIPERGYPLELIPPVPLPRRPSADLARLPTRVGAAVRAAGRVLDRLGADVVVGFGGYVALPSYVAARRRRIPVVIHEANAQPGVANRFAARFTPYVFTASRAIELPHARVVGMPLRPAISHLDRAELRPAARAEFDLDPEAPTLLVTGGSQGAQTINSAVLGALPALLEAGVNVLHIVGPKNELGQPRPGYRPVAYVHQMRMAYAAADFALCRSGAMTCAELSAVGLPAAYVPLPLRGGEQRRNAMPIVAAGGGLLVENDRLDPAWIEREVLPVLTDPDRLAVMSAAAAHSAERDADVVLAGEVLRIAAERRAAVDRRSGDGGRSRRR
jgi:UDP-N-acetylglucosamine--N-acetylmuramyl-(pentapeptide) pyrophosphoryl-undecaprenol N-acetylglucosamine transferase